MLEQGWLVKEMLRVVAAKRRINGVSDSLQSTRDNDNKQNTYNLTLRRKVVSSQTRTSPAGKFIQTIIITASIHGKIDRIG